MKRVAIKSYPRRRPRMHAIRKQDCLVIQTSLTPKELEAYKAFDPSIREKFDVIINNLSRRKVGANYIVPELTYENPNGESVIELRAYFDWKPLKRKEKKEV